MLHNIRIIEKKHLFPRGISQMRSSFEKKHAEPSGIGYNVEAN